MDHNLHTPVEAMDYSEDTLIDAIVYGPDDETIGSVAHVHGSGQSAQVIIDVGGFLGIGTKSVAVAARSLRFMRDDDGEVHAVTSWTKDEVKALPEHHH